MILKIYNTQNNNASFTHKKISAGSIHRNTKKAQLFLYIKEASQIG